MPAAAVVEALDPAEEGQSCLVTRLERVPVEELGLERGEEALGEGVGERWRLRSMSSLSSELSG